MAAALTRLPRLRRVDCGGPGYQRRRAGGGFTYLDLCGQRLIDPAELARIKALVIPPAWTEVWICAHPNGHIQAVGTDARGRRQYRYHDGWRVHRDREKFERMLSVADTLPALRTRVAADLALSGLPRERVLACAVRLLDLGFFRIGTDEYVEENGSYGLTTMRVEHVDIDGEAVVFDYVGKSGKHRVQSLVDPAVRDVVARLRRRREGGPEESARLLAWREGRAWVGVHSDDVNAYLREITDTAISAKDFRTWSVTVLAAVALAVSVEVASSPTASKRAVARAMREVSDYLGNTPAVCRASYVDPRVIDRYLDGVTIAADLVAVEGGARLPTQGLVEAAVVDLLRGERPRERANRARRRRSAARVRSAA